MIRAEDIFELLNNEFPFETQDSWDNSGLLIDSGEESEGVVVCLDVTQQVINKALETGSKIIVSHHPLIFSPLKNICSTDVVYQIIKNDINVISAHTNFDKYIYGTCFSIAESLGLEIIDTDFEYGLLAQGQPVTVRELGWQCKAQFGCAQISLPNKKVSQFFICAGSGSGLKEDILLSGADCFITGECKYHDILDLAAEDVAVVTVGHDNSEMISIDTIAHLIRKNFSDIQVHTFIADNLVYNI